MEPYKRFINKIYVKKFNHFLKNVVEKKFKDKYHQDIKLKLYGIKIKPKNKVYSEIPIDELLDTQANVLFFIDSKPLFDRGTFIADTIMTDGGLFLGLSTKNIWGIDTFEAGFYLNKRPLYELEYKAEEPLNEDIDSKSNLNQSTMTPYERFINPKYVNLFNKFLKFVITPKLNKKLGGTNINFKLSGINIEPKSSLYETIPIEELTDPQAIVYFFIDTYPHLGFLGRESVIMKTLYEMGGTTLGLRYENFYNYDYKNETFKADIKINKSHLYELDYQVGDSLNEFKGEQLNEGQYDYEDSEEYYEKIDKLLNKFLSVTGKEKDIPNFLGYRALTGKDRYSDFTVKLTGIFEKPFSSEDSDTIHAKSRKMIKLLRQMFPFLTKATFYGGSTSTLESYEQNLEWEKSYLNRKTKKDDDLPFLQEEKNGVKTRLFKEGIDNHELKWHFDELDRNVKVVKSKGWLLQMDDKLPVELKEGKTFFIPKGVYHRVIKGKGDLIVEIKEMKEPLILERNKNEYRMEIRKVVSDIINVFKKHTDGEFYLPEDIDEENMTYDFERLDVPFTVELQINVDKSIENFKLDGELLRDDTTIKILINYNPKNKEKSMYELVGDLNELIGHEIRHIHQEITGMFDLSVSEPKDSYKYYTQPHELDAQLFGFKRLSRLSKKPILDVIKRWFENNKDIHNLTDEETRKVIIKILEKK